MSHSASDYSVALLAHRHSWQAGLVDSLHAGKAISLQLAVQFEFNLNYSRQSDVTSLVVAVMVHDFKLHKLPSHPYIEIFKM